MIAFDQSQRDIEHLMHQEDASIQPQHRDRNDAQKRQRVEPRCGTVKGGNRR
jgi:hypothetical protein